jgi:hypothetical protein
METLHLRLISRFSAHSPNHFLHHLHRLHACLLTLVGLRMAIPIVCRLLSAVGC